MAPQRNRTKRELVRVIRRPRGAPKVIINLRALADEGFVPVVWKVPRIKKPRPAPLKVVATAKRKKGRNAEQGGANAGHESKQRLVRNARDLDVELIRQMGLLAIAADVGSCSKVRTQNPNIHARPGT